jgi:hypothetical protein
MKPNSYDISTHTFATLVIKSASSIITKADDGVSKRKRLSKKWRQSSRARLSPYQIYKVDVFHRLSNLVRVYNRLLNSRYLLRRTPNYSSSKSIRITRNDWTDYNFYVYTTSLASIADCLLLLIAQVCILNIPDKRCTLKRVFANPGLKHSKIKKTFFTLNDRLEHHILRRHRYLHRGEESSLEDYSSSGDIVSVRNISFLADHGTTMLPPKTIKLMWKMHLRDIDIKLDREEQQIFKSVSTLLNQLKKIYFHVIKSEKSHKSKQSAAS